MIRCYVQWNWYHLFRIFHQKGFVGGTPIIKGVICINDKYYGFNLKNKLERKTAKEIVLGNWTMVANADEYVIGWKVAKELPSWVNNAVAWEGFVIDIEDHAAGSEGLPLPEESIRDDMSFISEGSGMEQGVVTNMDDSDDVGEEENALYGK